MCGFVKFAMMVLSLSCIMLFFSLPVLAEVRETANLRDMEREWILPDDAAVRLK
jgi:hypothetical protein